MTTHHSRAATPQGRFQSLGTIYVLNISSHGNRKALTMNRKDFWSNNILKWTWIFNDGRPAQILALTVSIDVQFKASVKMENGRMIWCKKEQWKGFTFSRVLLFYTQKLKIVGGKVGGWTQYSGVQPMMRTVLRSCPIFGGYGLYSTVYPLCGRFSPKKGRLRLSNTAYNIPLTQ